MSSTIFDPFSALDPQRERNQIDKNIGGGGGSLTVTDGTHSVASVTSLTFSGATVSGTSPNAIATIPGGGGGAAIQPETGSSPIKISAFPNASANMGAGDKVTGLQGGANVNFSQAQILSTPNGSSPPPIYVKAGNNTGSGNGSYARIYAGNSSATSSNGGDGGLYGGRGVDGSNNPVGGARLYAQGGRSTYGGNATLYGGNGTASARGGNCHLYIGSNGGGGPGLFMLTNATSSPGSSAGTLTNAPSAGNPNVWLAITINGTPRFIPAW